jgi:LTR polyprotein gag-polypeptide-like protein
MSNECISVPTLAANGSNWVNYQDHLVVILWVKKLSDHLISDILTLHHIIPGDVNGLMPAQCWADNEDIILIILNASIPDAIYTQVKGSTNIKAVWDTLKTLFEGCSCNQIMDLTNKLQFSKCSEGDNLHTHFLDLINLHDQLLTMEKSFSNEDFATILLRSLPDSYKMQTLSIITLVDMTNTAIMPVLIIYMLLDKYDNCIHASTASNFTNSEAFKANGQGKKKPHNIQCKNCNKKGHIKANCWIKGGG